MKKFFVLFVLFAFKHSAIAQNQVLVHISNFENDKGVCRACIFSNGASFKNNKALQCAAVKVENKNAQVSFINVPDGSYAIFVFHDANNNNKMDRNFFGIPKEGYGASQNKLPFAAAPKFEENKFSLSNRTTLSLSIKLRNL